MILKCDQIEQYVNGKQMAQRLTHYLQNAIYGSRL